MKAAAYLAGETLLHDAVWRSDWARWLDSVGARGAVDAARGPAFSLYSLALDAALSGTGVLMGRLSLLQPYLTDGRLVAPLGPALATADRLTLLAPSDGPSHPRAKDVIEWLRGSSERDHLGRGIPSPVWERGRGEGRTMQDEASDGRASQVE